MRNKQISLFLICLLFASSCGGTSDNGDDATIEKLEAQVEALSQQLEKETPAEATPEEASTNEITVSPDAIVTTTTEASSLTSDDGMYLQTGLLKFVNYTDVPTEFLQENANLASSKMHSRNSDVIAIIYPLGRFISDEAPSYGGTFLGAEFEVVLTNDQINELVDELQDFLEQAECQSSSEIKKFASEVKQWLEIGGGSQLQVVFCRDVRVVLYSIDEDRRRDLYDIQRVFFHELYHAFQQDLGVDCEAGNSSLWVIEGAADYFANFLLAEIEDRPETLAESILHPALMLSEETGKAFKDPGVAEKGMIGLRLMVERGWLDESKIIDGSLFHNCVRVDDLVFDGAYIWGAVYSGFVFKLNASDGEVVDVYPVSHIADSVLFDGAHIWVAGDNADYDGRRVAGEGTVSKLNASDGEVVDVYPISHNIARILFDGAHIWVAGRDGISKLNASDGEVIGVYPVGLDPPEQRMGDRISWLGFDGTHVLINTVGLERSHVWKLRVSDGAPELLADLSYIDD
ncbi:hypothetical protein OAK28_01840, partial [Acidimicrobiia bacterium]|nr:hypothetical protein [Acidimicrobiia bacterium]